MASLRPFTCNDLFKFNSVQHYRIDRAQFNWGVKLAIDMYLARWPEYFLAVESCTGEIMGYIMGKSEGSVEAKEWHGHVTALSVRPESRRIGIAALLMDELEKISDKQKCFFVDLFVRVSNVTAVNMYLSLGYIVYRTVLEYYIGDDNENAYDMRKACSRDKEKKSMIPQKEPVWPDAVLP